MKSSPDYLTAYLKELRHCSASKPGTVGKSIKITYLEAIDVFDCHFSEWSRTYKITNPSCIFQSKQATSRQSNTKIVTAGLLFSKDVKKFCLMYPISLLPIWLIAFPRLLFLGLSAGKS